MIKWIIGLAIILVFGSILGSIMTTPLNSTDSDFMSVVKVLFKNIVEGWDYTSSGSIWQFIQGLVIMPVAFVRDVVSIMTLGTVPLPGDWQIIRYVIFLPIGIGVMVGLLLQLRGSSG